jgi:hypothetical protein
MQGAAGGKQKLYWRRPGSVNLTHAAQIGSAGRVMTAVDTVNEGSV